MRKKIYREKEMEGEREKKRKGRMNESVRNKLCKR